MRSGTERPIGKKKLKKKATTAREMDSGAEDRRTERRGVGRSRSAIRQTKRRTGRTITKSSRRPVKERRRRRRRRRLAAVIKTITTTPSAPQSQSRAGSLDPTRCSLLILGQSRRRHLIRTARRLFRRPSRVRSSLMNSHLEGDAASVAAPVTAFGYQRGCGLIGVSRATLFYRRRRRRDLR